MSAAGSVNSSRGPNMPAMTAGRHALVEAMRLEQARIYGQTLPDTRTQYAAGVPDCGFGPAPQHVIEALVADLTVAAVPGPRVPHHRRVAVEQAFARGEDDDTIAETLALPVDAVRDARDEHERLSA